MELQAGRLQMLDEDRLKQRALLFTHSSNAAQDDSGQPIQPCSEVYRLRPQPKSSSPFTARAGANHSCTRIVIAGAAKTDGLDHCAVQRLEFGIDRSLRNAAAAGQT